jgi:hypothetical protein
MDSTQSISEILLKFDPDGLRGVGSSPPQQARASGLLRPKAFREYEPIGTVALNDVITVRKIFERFGDMEIAISKSGNLLSVKGATKKVDIELVDESFIPADRGEPNIQFENSFQISSQAMKEIFDDAMLSKDSSLMIKTEDGKVIFSNTGKYKFATEIIAAGVKAGTSAKFGEPLIDAISYLKGMLTFHVRKDFPAKIEEKDELYEISIIAAPMVVDENDEG